MADNPDATLPLPFLSEIDDCGELFSEVAQLTCFDIDLNPGFPFRILSSSLFHSGFGANGKPGFEASFDMYVRLRYSHVFKVRMCKFGWRKSGWAKTRPARLLAVGMYMGQQVR